MPLLDLSPADDDFEGEDATDEMQRGTVTITVPAVNTPTSAALTFDPPFSEPPVVVVSAQSDTPFDLAASANGITTSAATLWADRTTGSGGVVVHWMAGVATQ